MVGQRTLKNIMRASGVGLHTGKRILMTVRPAAPDTGIVFRRTDLPEPVDIPARAENVGETMLGTVLSKGDVKVSTVEHLLSAFAGLGIDNALVEVSGPEVPIMDGSAVEFVRGLVAAGQRQLPDPLFAIRILRPVVVRQGVAEARLDPATTLQIDFEIDFPDRAIGRQHRVLDLSNGAFVRELASSRTFCRQSDVAEMQARGLALGGTLLNAVVVDGDAVLTPGGLRHPDEAVRHKMLDALGDLAMAGMPILGRYAGVRAGHAMTNRLLRALFDTPDAWRIVRVDRRTRARLPGAGVTGADLTAVA